VKVKWFIPDLTVAGCLNHLSIAINKFQLRSLLIQQIYNHLLAIVEDLRSKVSLKTIQMIMRRADDRARLVAEVRELRPVEWDGSSRLKIKTSNVLHYFTS